MLSSINNSKTGRWSLVNSGIFLKLGMEGVGWLRVSLNPLSSYRKDTSNNKNKVRDEEKEAPYRPSVRLMCKRGRVRKRNARNARKFCFGSRQ